MRVRQARRLTSRCILSVRGGGGHHKDFKRGGPLLHHGAGLLEEAQYGMEVHENHRSRVSPGAVGNTLVKGASVELSRQINEFLLNGQSKSWPAFGTEPHDVITTVGSVRDGQHGNQSGTAKSDVRIDPSVRGEMAAQARQVRPSLLSHTI